ncbi:stress response protein nst1-like [Sinocyclocheilus rhinocerous]|uniref:stress response protein nst1-like n=1 Tax=Sinocyclocheilus rhinocerous TaxID=307959 RepID=UPI0007BA9C4F|nr:PREDICTED: stress response protein nst1-like [Sinocyclocheilus rhinocerous]
MRSWQRCSVCEDEMWDTRFLEKMVNRTTLSTQRVLHTHILELGEQLCPWSSPNARTDDHLKLATNSVNLRPAIGREQPDAPTMEEFKQLKEKEKRAALRLQEESLQASFQEALRARDRLEAEMRRELQVELQAQFRAHCEDLRAQMEEEKVQAVGEACRKLQGQLHKEAEETRDKIIHTVREETQECVRRCVQDAERSIREECDLKSEREKRALQDRHEEEISELQSRIQQLQDSLEQACRERIQYEAEFKKVQASYRRFVDLTDSSLHSDYLLKLRRLGTEPGLMDTATQTDEITS